MLRSVSFAEDWRNLALLFALFLAIPPAPLADMKVAPFKVADHASAAEIKLLRAMLGVEKVERLDGAYVTRRIDDIIDDITADVASDEAKLCLAVRLGASSGLSEPIRHASVGQIEITDEAQQIRFIAHDLSGQPQLAAVKGYDARHDHDALRTAFSTATSHSTSTTPLTRTLTPPMAISTRFASQEVGCSGIAGRRHHDRRKCGQDLAGSARRSVAFRPGWPGPAIRCCASAGCSAGLPAPVVQLPPGQPGHLASVSVQPFPVRAGELPRQ